MENVARGDRRAQPQTGDCLERTIAALGADASERRHEAVLERAEQELGLGRAFAEQVYALAEEEDLAPVYAFALIGCGIGVRELEPLETDGTLETDFAAQQAPPGWEQEDTVELNDVALERRLRTTFRRFRAALERASDAVDAARTFVQETDVGRVALRPKTEE